MYARHKLPDCNCVHTVGVIMISNQTDHNMHGCLAITENASGRIDQLTLITVILPTLRVHVLNFIIIFLAKQNTMQRLSLKKYIKELSLL